MKFFKLHLVGRMKNKRIKNKYNFSLFSLKEKYKDEKYNSYKFNQRELEYDKNNSWLTEKIHKSHM